MEEKKMIAEFININKWFENLKTYFLAFLHGWVLSIIKDKQISFNT